MCSLMMHRRNSVRPDEQAKNASEIEIGLEQAGVFGCSPESCSLPQLGNEVAGTCIQGYHLDIKLRPDHQRGFGRVGGDG